VFFWKVGYVLKLKGPVMQPAALAFACCCYSFLSDLRLPWLLVSGFIELVLIDSASVVWDCGCSFVANGG